MLCRMVTYAARCVTCLPRWKFLFQNFSHNHQPVTVSVLKLSWISNTFFHTSCSNYQFKSRKPYGQKFVDILEVLDGKDDMYMLPAEWEAIEKAVQEESPRFLYSFDYSMMKHFKTTGKPDLARSFMDYLKSKREPNTSTYLEYIDVCFEKYDDLGFDEFKKVVTNRLNGVADKVFTNRIISLCSRVLSTKYWKESLPLSFDVLNCNMLNSDVRKDFVFDVLKTALRRQDYKVFYDHLVEVDVVYNEIKDILYQMLLDKRIPVDVFLELFKVGNCSLTLPQARYLKDECFRTKCMQAKLTSQKRDVCSNCDRMFSQTCVSPEQMNILCKQIHDNIVVTDNVYKTTTPRELKDFIKFVKEHGPFSCVIDGLNTGFLLGQGSFIHYKSGIWQKLLRRVSTVAPGKILVVDRHGGQHTHMEVIQLLPTVLQCRHDFRSSDDCFILLAAAMSGPECRYISNDMYRDHQVLVEKDAKQIFKLWQLKNRLHIANDDIQLSTHISAHETDKSWHVPVQELDKNFYLCITKHQYRPSSELLHVRKCQMAASNSWQTKKQTKH